MSLLNKDLLYPFSTRSRGAGKEEVAAKMKKEEAQARVDAKCLFQVSQRQFMAFVRCSA
jgi:hypothetical protein